MATYKQIQDGVKKNYGFTVKTCWIADVKEMCGLLNQEKHQTDLMKVKGLIQVP